MASDPGDENDCKGFLINGLKPGRGLKVVTRNHTYTVRKLADGTFTIKGHPEYCPKRVKCNIHGSFQPRNIFAGYKVDYIGIGMRLEVGIIYNGGPTSMVTSVVASVEEIA